ncbi:Nramp family divalent metal transporter [Kutzneria sp. CA-103260]|uniref:Nramp family divalent metal transporter n=1 Tax=Kutzneria sp. CA-103260 TaxID=2802641 RepID=UPI001BF09242|nr:Nramp family divalent metal transporter [Kutzneria sp. CA-103260]QUQ66474.1 metal ion transporter Nramp family protein [Kutzneria sp. CA-103260]
MLERDPATVTTLRPAISAKLVGPAFVAAVAYIDPGNFATNITAGGLFGYRLLWVIVVANVMAMLVQYLSAKLGIATGRDLPELCRQHFPRPVSRGLWVQAELVAMATDLAELVGAAVGLNLLFGVPLPIAGVLTALVAFGVLALEQRGRRPFELAIAAMFGVVFLGFAYDLATVGAHGPEVAAGLVPGFAGSSSVLLAVSIIGATVMPHVIYLHSALTKKRAHHRSDLSRHTLLRSQAVDVLLALGTAGLINMAMLVLAASLPITGDPILSAHDSLGRLVGGGAALAFAVALLASGVSSSSVGTYAGQVVMRGFIRRGIPLYVRRSITMLPGLTVLALGLPTTDSLVISQVALSFGIPFALIPLVLLTRRRDVMGSFVNRRVTTIAAAGCAALITVLNGYLIVAEVLGA